MPLHKPISVAVAIAVQSMSLQAQETQSGAALEEITVTATRRAESVLDIPYNITALTSDQLAAAGRERPGCHDSNGSRPQRLR